MCASKTNRIHSSVTAFSRRLAHIVVASVCPSRIDRIARSPDRDTPRPNLGRDRPLTRLATSRRPDARRYRHGNISPHLFPTRDGVVVGAPSVVRVRDSVELPFNRETVGRVLSCPFTTSRDSINHRGTRLSRAHFASHPRSRFNNKRASSRRTRFGPDEEFMTTSPRFFAATLTVLAETRFVDVRACIIFAFRKFRVRVYADAFVVLATPTMPRAVWVGVESANREPSI